MAKTHKHINQFDNSNSSYIIMDAKLPNYCQKLTIERNLGKKTQS